MDTFTDQDFKNFLNKEWLVRIDNATSQPYLFKCHGSTEGRWTILITDTANVWFEALDPKQLARRWRQLNQSPEPFVDQRQESEWRAKTSRTLSSVHTMTSIQDCVFSIENSRDADLAFELQAADCKWRWECYLLGPKTSARVLSRHLIHPLLSVAYLAFTSAGPISNLTVDDLQQAVDKVAKTGRRAHDVHVRQIVSRPRVATTLARMTAMFNFADPLPRIISEFDPQEQDVDMNAVEVHMSNRHIQPSADSSSSTTTEIQHEPLPIRTHDHSSPSAANIATSSFLPPIPDSVTRQKEKQDQTGTQKQKQMQKEKQKQNTGTTEKAMPALDSPSSATEPESGSGDEELLVISLADSAQQQKAGPSSQASSMPPPQAILQAEAEADASDSSEPRRASKKVKLGAVQDNSDSDTSGGEAKRQVVERPSSRPTSALRGPGVRQPIKRGGRRF